MLAIDRFKILLNDSQLKEKYKITEDVIQSITMTPSPDEIEKQDMMVVLIRELVKKQSEKITSNNASSQLNVILDSRLPKHIERKK